MIKSFSVTGYRNVRAEGLEFGSLNLLIGPNNSGKSNFVKAMGFMRDMLGAGAPTSRRSDPMVEAASAHGGWRMKDRRSDRAEIAMHWVRSTGSDQFTYATQFAVSEPTNLFGTAVHLHDELLGFQSSIFNVNAKITYRQTGPGRSHLTVEQDEQILSTHDIQAGDRTAGGSLFHSDALRAQDVQLRQPQISLQTLLGWSTYSLPDELSYSCNRFQLQPLSHAQDALSGVTHLDVDAVQLPNVLRTWELRPEGLEDFTQAMGALVPGLQRVWVQEGGGSRWVNLRLGGKQYELHEMSDGTLQAMALAFLLHTPFRMSTLCLDEPEVNLHPAWQKVVGRWILQRKSADQLFISTHSPDLLDVFTEAFRAGEAKVFVFKPTTAEPPTESVVREVTAQELETFFEEGWELGDLYRTGEPQLGGWPW